MYLILCSFSSSLDAWEFFYFIWIIVFCFRWRAKWFDKGRVVENYIIYDCKCEYTAVAIGSDT